MNEFKCKHQPQYKFCENKAYCTDINLFDETRKRLEYLDSEVKQLKKIEQLILNGGKVKGENEDTILNKIVKLQDEGKYLIALRTVISEQCFKKRRASK